MKYKVSVIKKIAFLVMTMALAVAMVACSGAAGTPGPAGPPGKDAPAPDPTTPTTPTTPTPTEPTGAAPEVTKMFPDIYLTLAGSAGDKDRSFTLREHFADIDSLLKYTAASSDAMIATAAVTDGVLKVTAIKDGSATITVTAADDEGLTTAVDDFSVTVAKTNAAPTTHGLSITDATALQKRLYYRDGARTHNNITVVSNAGAATGAVAVTDSILTDDFKVVVGADDAGVDDKIAVKVTKTGAHSYSIVITPKATGFGGDMSQPVKIYPKDMFRAPVADPWEFTAMYNPPPKVLSPSFHLELKRSEAGTNTNPAIQTVTAGATGAGATGGVTGNVGRVIISDFFILDSLERTTGTPETVGSTDHAIDDDNDVTALAASPATAATRVALAKIDKVTDTVCTVSQSSSSMAVVMSLNEAGVFSIGQAAEAEVAHMSLLVVPEVQALNAIRIDSRYSALGTDNIQTDPPTTPVTPANHATYQNTKDTPATSTGTFTVTISCTDKDETETVTGTVVVRS